MWNAVENQDNLEHTARPKTPKIYTRGDQNIDSPSALIDMLI